MRKSKALLLILLIPWVTFGQFRDSQKIGIIDDTLRIKRSIYGLADIMDYYTIPNPDSALYYGEKALILAKSINDTHLCNVVYQNIGIASSFKGNLDKSLEYYNEGLNYSKTARDSVIFIGNIGITYTMQGKYKLAEEYFFQALHIYIEENNVNGIVNIVSNSNTLLINQGRYVEATTRYFAVLEILKGYDDEGLVASVYQNLAIIFATIEDYEKALFYNLEALKLFLKLENKQSVCGVLINMGEMKFQEGDNEDAMKYLNTALKISTKLGFKHLLPHTYSSIANIHYVNKEYEKALILQKKSLNIRIREGILNDRSSNYFRLAEIYIAIEDYEKAETSAEEALKLSSQAYDKTYIKDSYKLLGEIYLAQKNYKQAYTYQNKYNQLKDSLFNIEKAKEITNIETSYKTKEKEAVIEKMQVQESLQEQKITNKNRFIIVLIVAMILIVAVFVFITKLLRERQRYNSERKMLKLKIEIEEKTKDEIAKELHDGIAGNLAGIIANIEYEGSLKKNSEGLCKLRETYLQARDISHTLAEPMFTNTTVSEKIESEIKSIADKNDINIEFSENIKAEWMQIKDAQNIQKEIYRIYQELIANTIKHSRASEVFIQLTMDKSKLIFIFEDNGIGFNGQNVKKGIGLINIHKRVDSLNGSLSIDAQENNGLVASIEIPFHGKVQNNE